MERVIYRHGNGRWCALRIRLEETNNGGWRLSITGDEGRLTSHPRRDDEVVKREGSRAYVLESCGQIRDTLAHWFPESKPYFQWHLNDMHAGCEHQDALGWTQANMSQPCPTCGYKWGHAWTTRELPSDVIAWAQTFGA